MVGAGGTSSLGWELTDLSSVGNHASSQNTSEIAPPSSTLLDRFATYCSSEKVLTKSKLIMEIGLGAMLGELIAGGTLGGSALIVGSLIIISGAVVYGAHKAACLYLQNDAVPQTDNNAVPSSGLLHRFINVVGSESTQEASIFLVNLGIGAIVGEFFASGALCGSGLIVGVPVLLTGALLYGVNWAASSYEDSNLSATESKDASATLAPPPPPSPTLLERFTNYCSSDSLLSTSKILMEIGAGAMACELIAAGTLGGSAIITGTLIVTAGAVLYGIHRLALYAQSDAAPSSSLLDRFTSFVTESLDFESAEDMSMFIVNVGIGAILGEYFASDELVGPGLLIGVPILLTGAVLYGINWAASTYAEPDLPVQTVIN